MLASRSLSSIVKTAERHPANSKETKLLSINLVKNIKYKI